MILEERIQQLEQKLMIKKAYLSVEIKFPRGNNIPEDIKERITTELKTACTQLAEEQELEINSSTLTFNSEEVQILKQLAAAVAQKTNKKTPTTTVIANSDETSDNYGSKARIMMLDSVDKTLRNKIEPQSMVRVKGSNEGKHFVETLDGKARRFWVDTEDLDFNIE